MSSTQESWRHWLDHAVAAVLALAAVGTAWAGFQSSKWTGVQANSYAQSSKVRVESTQHATRAGQQQSIDVNTFTQWLTALNQETHGDPNKLPQGGYTPNPKAVSGFLFSRFRPEFKSAVKAWLATHPLQNPQAPATPFVMPQYKLAEQTKSDQLVRQAESSAAVARQANQRSDNYVLTAVVFALVLFFAAMAGRIQSRLAQPVLMSLAVIALVGSCIALAVFPVQI